MYILYLGYRLVMKGQELVSASRLHVDYAQARDDQYEWEMKKRHLMREERRLQQTRSNPPPSPPLIPHFTEAKALSVSEEIKGNYFIRFLYLNNIFSIKYLYLLFYS